MWKARRHFLDGLRLQAPGPRSRLTREGGVLCLRTLPLSLENEALPASPSDTCRGAATLGRSGSVTWAGLPPSPGPGCLAPLRSQPPGEECSRDPPGRPAILQDTVFPPFLASRFKFLAEADLGSTVVCTNLF